MLVFECKWGGTLYTLTFGDADSTVGDLQQMLFTMTAVLPSDQVPVYVCDDERTFKTPMQTLL